MNQENKKDKIISLCVSIGLHALLFILFIFLGFEYKSPDDESGVLLMMGEVELSAGNETQQTTDIPQTQSSVLPQPSAQKIEEPLITQNTEEALPVIPSEEEMKEKEEREKRKVEEQRQKEEELRKAEEEARRKAEEEAKKRLAAQNLVSGAFGKNNGTGDNANNKQGNVNGNNDSGVSQGNAGYGQYDLGGRGLIGTLPRPAFDINASGKVVVKITVNPQGMVIGTEITQGTTTSSQVLRTAAIDAAKRARFSATENTGNQQGTITYLFDSNN